MLDLNATYLFPMHKKDNIDENDEELIECKLICHNKFQVEVIPNNPEYENKWFDINYLEWLINEKATIATPYAMATQRGRKEK